MIFPRKSSYRWFFFSDIKCVLDTTNIEKIGVAISKKLKIDCVGYFVHFYHKKQTLFF